MRTLCMKNVYIVFQLYIENVGHNYILAYKFIISIFMLLTYKKPNPKSFPVQVLISPEFVTKKNIYSKTAVQQIAKQNDKFAHVCTDRYAT